MRNVIILLLIAVPLFAAAVYGASLYASPAPQPAPCVEPQPQSIELHDAESITAAGLEAFYGGELDGGPTRD